MFRPYRQDLKQLGRDLRCNSTDSERLLWSRLRRKQILGIQFYRQKPIGDFIVDFYAPVAKLVIEVDGGQHFQGPKQMKDRERDGRLRAQGLKVLRFDNLQVLKDTDAVLNVILTSIRKD